MIILSPKQSSILVISALAVLALAILAYIVIPSAKQIVSLNQRMAETEKYLDGRLARGRQGRRSVQRMGEIHDRALTYQGGLIEMNNELPLITKLEENSARAHVDQTLHVEFHDGLPAGQAGEKGQAPYYTFSFVLSAPFANLMSYLQALEGIAPYIVIDELRWEKRQQGALADDHRVTLRFDGKIFTR